MEIKQTCYATNNQLTFHVIIIHPSKRLPKIPNRIQHEVCLKMKPEQGKKMLPKQGPGLNYLNIKRENLIL